MLVAEHPDGGEKRTLIRFLSYTSLRWGEGVALRVRDLDPARRRAVVVKNAVRVGGRILVGAAKSHRARPVPLPESLVAELDAIGASRSRDSLVFGNWTTFLNQPTITGGWFVQAVKRAQDADPTFPTPTIHDLRHTAAILAVSAGANVKAVQRMPGPASAAMTLDVYADLLDEDLAAGSAALDRARAAEVVHFSRSLADPEVAAERLNPRRSGAEAP